MDGADAREFTQWCRTSLFTDELVAAVALQERALDLHLARIFSELDLRSRLSDWVSPARLAETLNFVESAEITMEAILLRLSRSSDLVEHREEGGVQEFRATGVVPDATDGLQEIRQKLHELGDDYEVAIEFMDFGAEQFSHALGEDPEFMDRILSGREPEFSELWDRATNTDPIQDVHGKMGARAIHLLMGDRLNVLEVGGGTGNGIRHLLSHLKLTNALDRLSSYTFTDISPRFIMETRHALRDEFSSVPLKWKFLDINRPFAEQKIQGGFDLIYGVNAAHVAKDVVGFLKECWNALEPGGRVLFAERVRLDPTAMAPRELALNLSIYHRTAAERNSDYRPMHCYLSPENWLRVFAEAGFTDADILPDLPELAESFPHQYAAVVTAVRP
jgi:SAM-dependent methyltransferase